jgi:hypothetical protein
MVLIEEEEHQKGGGIPVKGWLYTVKVLGVMGERTVCCR